jgi:hypothetical protein
MAGGFLRAECYNGNGVAGRNLVGRNGVVLGGSRAPLNARAKLARTLDAPK